MQEEESQREVKIVIIGDSNVGKTSGFAPLINYSTSLIKYWDTILGLMLRYVDNTFSPQAVNINVDFKEKIFNHSSGAQLSCKLWDTAGQERYRTITSSFYRDADIIVLVYDQSDESSFANLDKWKSEIDSFLPYADKILVANKIDLHDARVAKETAKSWASTNGYLFAECSAKSGSNVQSTFEQVINAYYEHSMHMKPKKKKQQVSLKKPADAKEKKKSFPCLI